MFNDVKWCTRPGKASEHYYCGNDGVGDHDNNDHYLEVSQYRKQNSMLHVKRPEL